VPFLPLFTESETDVSFDNDKHPLPIASIEESNNGRTCHPCRIRRSRRSRSGQKAEEKTVHHRGHVRGASGGGAGAWFLTQSGHDTKESDTAPSRVPVYLALETFTVNLQRDEQYLQTDITLQLSDPSQAEAIKMHMPRVRSRLLTLLSSKQADELITAEDKKKLAQEILAQVRLPFDANGKPQQVDDVLFTTFVIQ